MIPWARFGTPRDDHINNLEAENKLVHWLDEQIQQGEDGNPSGSQ